ncbi:hypothetical protein PoB_001274900 [Plakobranchus ocellatus]|uniref:Uncharacterized protein n=1 Tax=Plakobranchus ocellatus TaxID=259542 RepID=A0AAV3YWZ3_9GAST|nr:hypothetical protein PoB_001274900 [Plakobranchus ocellatus]
MQVRDFSFDGYLCLRHRTSSNIIRCEIGFCVHPQQGDLRFSGPPSCQGAGGEARTRDRRVPADLRADSLTTEPLTPR